MPELPEVETVARQLNAAIAGRRIRHLRLLDPKLRAAGRLSVDDYRIEAVRRYGKQVVFELVPPRKRSVARWLCVHLRMTGRLIHVPAGQTMDATKARAVIELDHGGVLFRDTRRFGTIGIHEDQAAVLPAGVEPLSNELTVARLKELLANSPTPLKTWLLMQDRLVGLGNIYASEICFAAGIHPARPAGRLSDAEIRRLRTAIRRILTAAIKHCGTTFSDFQDSRGEVGGYVKYLKVYHRAGEPCRRCSTPIEKITQAQRSTYFCPTCQPD
ncbi:bifunctional DNA-formamidopyrimidine glycosylase/DNA-(apurinic or apyrimidinic site) lyase [bacterium]|nr:bifunctional DNA-formamidopyrimidine glycosylase/DNA-(apurinic or apyrimidinic site) lyase [bacterium]